jgi:CDGSH-type Zn-finger protein
MLVSEPDMRSGEIVRSRRVAPMSDDRDQSPRIEAIEDGPLKYRRGTGDARALLLDADRQEIACRDTALLCRCGSSGRKPFCDGSHVDVGFTGERKWKSGAGSEIDHVGTRITIHDNRALCAHVEYCVTELPAVFDRSRRPWVDADAAGVDEIVAICEKCPSGALSYSIDGVRATPPARRSAVVVSAEGPYFVEGDVAVIDPHLPEGPADGHCTLCRCGQSSNKPLCDGKHRTSGFPPAE